MAKDDAHGRTAARGTLRQPFEPPRRTPDMDALYGRLAEADETDDAKALAALAWELYGLLGLEEADLNCLRVRLHQLLPAAA